MLTPISDRRYLIPFRSQLLPAIFADTLVIGSGVAGLRAALAAAEHGEVIVVAKDDLEKTNTAWAQGGIAAVLADDDSAAEHVADTLAAGAGLCSVDTVRTLVDEGPREVEWLVELGMRFDRDEGGGLALTREGGHARRRIVHTDGDATGRELSRALLDVPRASPHPALRPLLRARLSDRGDRPARRRPRARRHHPSSEVRTATHLGARDDSRLGWHGATLARDDEFTRRDR